MADLVALSQSPSGTASSMTPSTRLSGATAASAGTVPHTGGHGPTSHQQLLQDGPTVHDAAIPSSPVKTGTSTTPTTAPDTSDQAMHTATPALQASGHTRADTMLPLYHCNPAITGMKRQYKGVCVTLLYQPTPGTPGGGAQQTWYKRPPVRALRSFPGSNI